MMPPELRRAMLMFAGVVMVLAVVWASRFDSTEPAQFSFQNGTDPKTLDPHRATGSPESRILFNIFTGLLQLLPDGPADPQTNLRPMTPQPGVAESYTVSEDNLTYTFRLRRDAVWNDGTPITSKDYVWSWTRMLHPETACEYNFQLFSVPYAEDFALARIKIGDRVEVELWDRPEDVPGGDPSLQAFPRGTMLYGILKDIRKPADPVDAPESWVYEVDLVSVDESGTVDWSNVQSTQTFCQVTDSPVADETTKQTHRVLVAFDKLGGLETPDDHTFVVHLKDPLPYFPYLVAYYPMFAVPKHCVEKHGMPLWTKAENIVSNGPYRLQTRRLRDRLRLAKNENWFNAKSVSVESIDVISAEGQNTALNMYETGQLDWVTDPPQAFMETLRQRDDFHSAPQLSVYFYRINTTRPPLNDVRVRRALAMAINRVQIVEQVTKAGQVPAYTLVPPGIAGYHSPAGLQPDIEKAKQLLTEAGYPGGRGIPKISLLYNTLEGHRAIAEVIQQQLQNNLNVKLELQNMEWGSFLDKVLQIDYDIARAGWIADYPDPNTFLDLWLTDGAQNNTGWSNARFDSLLQEAAAEKDSKKRMELLAEAEAIWIEEMPVIPVYFYVSMNLVKPHVEGFWPSPQDIHPFQLLRLK